MVKWYDAATGPPAYHTAGAVTVEAAAVAGLDDRPSRRSPMARSMARAVRRTNAMVSAWPPLRNFVNVTPAALTPTAVTPPTPRQAVIVRHCEQLGARREASPVCPAVGGGVISAIRARRPSLEVVDWALSHAALHSRFADGDLAAIIAHRASTRPGAVVERGETHSLEPGTGAWKGFGR